MPQFSANIAGGSRGYSVDRVGGFRPAGAVPPVLDLIATASIGAYSIFRLRTAYSGAALRVRRSSDNAEQDIGFAGNSLDVSALLTFVGSGDGFVTTWYDQSGNGRHLTQVTAANQQKIVAAGAYLTGLKADANTTQRVDLVDAAFGLAASAATISSVLRATTPGGTALGAIWHLGGVSGARIWLGAGVGNRDVTIRNGGNLTASPTQTMGSGGNIITFTKNASADVSACSTRLNGSAASTYGASAVGATDNRFGTNQNGAGTACGDHTHGELIIWNAALSAGDITTLERNQGARFGIAVA